MIVSNYLPQEVSLGTLGTVIGAASYVASELTENVVLQNAPTFARNVVSYSCYGGMLAGIVLCTYSMIRLAKRILEQNNELNKPVTLAALGVLFTAISHADCDHFWDIAPGFSFLDGASLTYAISTNFAWAACGIAGFAGAILTIYAVYRVGEYLLRNQLTETQSI